MPALQSVTSSPMPAARAHLDHRRTEALIEHALVLLAEVERRYESERSIIEGALHPQPWKDWRLEQLEYRRLYERQPIVQQLCILHHRRTTAAHFPSLGQVFPLSATAGICIKTTPRSYETELASDSDLGEWNA